MKYFIIIMAITGCFISLWYHIHSIFFIEKFSLFYGFMSGLTSIGLYFLCVIYFYRNGFSYSKEKFWEYFLVSLSLLVFLCVSILQLVCNIFSGLC